MIEAVLTAETLRSLLHYDPDTGLFRWLVRLGTAKAGDIAGATRADGYVVIRIRKKLYYAHRLAWLYMTGEWPSNLIDHENVNPSDNRWTTLREATKSQNGMNRGAPILNSTGFKGVSPFKGGYRAQIVARGEHFDLGIHKTKEEAHQAYVSAAQRLHGEFARVA